MQIFQKQPAPYSNCRFNTSTTDPTTDSIYYQYVITNLTNTQYSQQLCYEICYQDLINIICQCNNPSNNFTLNYSYPLCINNTQTKCASEVQSECTTSDQNCKCYNACPLECDSSTYATSISLSNFVSLLCH